MNSALKIMFEDFKKETKKVGKSEYNACYDGLLLYLDSRSEIYNNKTVPEVFEAISMVEIEYAGKKYCESSKKTKTEQAIHRFLLAVDYFNNKYLKTRNIECKALRGGCHNKKTFCNIVNIVNGISESKIYLPLKEDDIAVVNKCADNLDCNYFYSLEQKIICQLFITYGFKPNRIYDLMKEDFHDEEKTLTISSELGDIVLQLEKYFCDELILLNKIHKFQNRELLFTNTVGKKLTASSILGESFKNNVKQEGVTNFNPTTIGLYGVVNLLNRSLPIGAIVALTGYDADKIEAVSNYALTESDISKEINNKL
ncbi:MAG: hypothetical protein K0S61_3975 [Anaerocolumna sp.]|jgi:hypothetical protein|nr:hypothetical protein [Anaerocolumna sp.]